MSPQYWKRIRDVFEAAVDLTDSELESYLQSASDGDVELYNTVRQMIVEDQRFGGLDISPLRPPSAASGAASAAGVSSDVARDHGSENSKPDGLELVGARYERLELIGAGGMGEVYRAKDRMTGDLVALKRMAGGAGMRPLSGQDRTRAWSKFTQFHAAQASHKSRSKRVALAREFRVLSSLRHPNIIPVLDFGFESNGYPFFTMSLLEKAHRLTEAAVNEDLAGKFRLLFEVLQALCYLHRHGVLHRDLKPSNILVCGQRVTLVDFGISGLSERHFAGTPAYMAPELWTCQRPSIASDLYAFGVVAFEILAGRDPEQADADSFDGPATLRPVIGRLLAHDSSHRYSDANHVLRDLAEAANLTQPAETIGHRESYLRAAPLVDRRTELSRMIWTWRKAARGDGGCLLLSGESGTGKTRLIEELRVRALVRGAVVLSGAAEEAAAAPYSAFKSAALRLALLVPLDDLEMSTLKTVFPDIASVLRRRDPQVETDPQTLPERLPECLAGLVRRYGKPVMLALEDCHNLKEELPILRKLSAAARDLPLLIVGSYRSEERPSLPQEFPEATMLQILRFDTQAIRDLSAAILGEELGANPTLVSYLERETEGNAFFIVEAMRALAEHRGSLFAVKPEAIPNDIFPRGIHNALQRRLGRMPAWARSQLQLSAIIGREVNPAILADAGADADLGPFLNVCDRLSILEGHGYTWRFTHDKLRAAVLQEMDGEDRASLHRRVAQAIENRFTGENDWLQALAFHWREGGIREKSASYSLKAAAQALSLGLPEKAVELLLESLGVLGVAVPAEKSELQWAIGEEATRIERLLATRTSEELMALPVIRDPRIEQVIRTLTLIPPAAHMSQRAELFAFSALKCMSLMLEHGAGPWIAEVLALFTVVLHGMTKNSRRADKYIQLAAHYDRKNCGRLSGAVAFIDAWFVRHWLHPLKASILLASEGQTSAAADGDALYHGFCVSSLVMYQAASGTPLLEVIQSAELQLNEIRGRVRVAAFHCILERQFACALAGLTQNRFSLTDPIWDEQKDLAWICSSTNHTQIAYYHVARMRIHYYYGEYGKAIEYGELALPLLPAFRGQILEWIHAVYRALALLASAANRPEPERGNRVTTATALVRQMEGWAADNPEGFLHLRNLLRAELARTELEWLDAGQLYAEAAKGAAALGAVHDVALIEERAATLFIENGEWDRGRLHLDAAVRAYAFWGAEAKIAWLKEQYACL